MMAKNKILLIVIILVAAVLTVAVFLYYRQYASGPKLSPAEIERQLIEKLTAPSNKEVPASKDVTEKLTAPKKSVPVSSEIIDKLSAPAQ